MNIEAVLRPLADLERSVAELYEWYSDLFASDPEASRAFSRMAIEEQGHARLVEYQRKLVRNDASLSVDVTMDLDGINGVLETVRSLRAAAPPPTLEQAIRASLSIEERSAESHDRNALKLAVPRVALLLAALGSEDRLHDGRLRELAVRRGIPLG